jgi:hypothetical protein
MINPKMESRNKKMTKSLTKHCFCCCFLLWLCFEISCKGREIGGRESLKNGRIFWQMWL